MTISIVVMMGQNGIWSLELGSGQVKSFSLVWFSVSFGTILWIEDRMINKILDSLKIF